MTTFADLTAAAMTAQEKTTETMIATLRAVCWK